MRWPKLVSCVILCAWSISAVCLTGREAAGAETSSTGGSQPLDNLQPSLALNYLIALDGTFPSQNGSGAGGASSDPFIGEISLFAGNFAPRGWAEARGQLLQISQYPALFSILGTQYGGNGETNFGLPDFRGRTAVHASSGVGAPFLGHKYGSSQIALSEAHLPSHQHTTLEAENPTSSSGAGSSFSTSQPSQSVNFITALFGTEPSETTSGNGSSGGSGGGIDPFLGEVSLFAGNDAPAGWAELDGQTLMISQNDPLFTIFGTTYGGDGQSTFDLPDARARAVLHPGTGSGLTTRNLGGDYGVNDVTLSSSQMPQHAHKLLPTSNDTGNAGGSSAIENLQPSTGLNYIIALQGVFPSRDGSGSGDEDFPEDGGSGGASEPLLGQISLFGGNFAPTGWAFLDGQVLQISQNLALFSVLGTTYGGDGQSTFALPDLRGRVPIGFGQGPGLPNYSLGQETGLETLSLSEVNLPAHTHLFQYRGDYNNDGVVNAADYTVWRDTLGSMADLRADGDDNGVVDAIDYAVWRESYHATNTLSGSGGTSHETIPEPASLVLLLTCVSLGLYRVRQTRSLG